MTRPPSTAASRRVRGRERGGRGRRLADDCARPSRGAGVRPAPLPCDEPQRGRDQADALKRRARRRAQRALGDDGRRALRRLAAPARDRAADEAAVAVCRPAGGAAGTARGDGGVACREPARARGPRSVHHGGAQAQRGAPSVAGCAGAGGRGRGCNPPPPCRTHACPRCGTAPQRTRTASGTSSSKASPAPANAPRRRRRWWRGRCVAWRVGRRRCQRRHTLLC